MKKFLAKIITFSIPIVIIFLIPASFLVISGENYKTIDDIIVNEENYLIGYAYNEENYRYLKYKELETQNSLSVIALGSSRILQFRSKMFTKSFYNAGYTISSISDFIPFIKTNLKNKKPKVLLISLDQWMFNENWDDLSNYDLTNKVWLSNFRKNATVTTFRNVSSDLLKGKYGFEILTQHKKSNETKIIGLNALVNNKGFRKDGSMHYGNHINKLLNNDSTAKDFNYLNTYSRIDKGNKRFEYGNQVNDKAIKALNDLLTYCKTNGIYVVAILPPFADKINIRLKQNGKYTYMDSIFYKSNKLFKEQGFELWDMSNLNKYGSNDSETIDGFHGSEVSYLKMLVYMIENGSILKNYTNLNNLRNDLDNKKNNYQVYD
ncbi:hypothetical protein [Flavobacterium sp.]|uniref:hypothetical protein n=1 Tax=Flavobacterium sp. TaxID=239 RepID=UPI0040486182